MVNQQLQESGQPDLFLEFLLRCALTAPGAATSPTAGRILARLLVVGAIEGGDQLVTPYLVPIPGEDASFEVRAYHPGNLEPTEVRSGLAAAAALKMALRAARDGDDGIEVVSRGRSGLERCVLVRDATGDFEFRFAGGETLMGDPEECATARRAWAVTLADWRAWVAEEHPPPQPSEGFGTGGLASDPPRPSTPLRVWWVPQLDDSDEVDEGAGAAEVEDAVPDIEPPVATQPEPELEEEGEWPEPAAASGERAPGAPWGGADVAAVIGAIEESLSRLTVKPDLREVEELIARAMTGDRDLVEPLARRLSARLGESLGRADPREVVDALLPLIPRPGEVAEAVTADVTALLSEVLLRRRPGELTGGLEGQGIMAAIEKLQVQMDGVRDQLRRSSGALQAIDERLEVSDRRTQAAERIGTSIEQEMQRLALRIDEQVTALAATAGGGSEHSDGVARLTRKLRQSVIQLDRALLRLDELVEHPALPRAPAAVPAPAPHGAQAVAAATADIPARPGPAGAVSLPRWG